MKLISTELLDISYTLISLSEQIIHVQMSKGLPHYASGEATDHQALLYHGQVCGMPISIIRVRSYLRVISHDVEYERTIQYSRN